MTDKFYYYHLYVKTHNKTGLKYLGFTTTDPYTYKGSGIYWLRHLKEHGNDITTEIIGTYSTKEELINAGIHYSNLWNIVESEQWANLTIEQGDCGPTWTIKRRAKMSQTIKQLYNDPAYHILTSERTKTAMANPELRAYLSNLKKGKPSPKRGTKYTPEQYKNRYQPNLKGRKYYNNGTKQGMYVIGTQPDGWQLGCINNGWQTGTRKRNTS